MTSRKVSFSDNEIEPSLGFPSSEVDSSVRSHRSVSDSKKMNPSDPLTRPFYTPEERTLFRQLFSQIDSQKEGVVSGNTVVQTFRASKLSTKLLWEIWELIDPQGNGFLDFEQFSLALKYIAAAQSNLPLTVASVQKPLPLPNLYGHMNFLATEASNSVTHTVPSVLPSDYPIDTQTKLPVGHPFSSPVSSSVSLSSMSITPDDQARFIKVFQDAKLKDGFLEGDEAKQIFLMSKLPVQTLGQIWDLADVDGDGRLSQSEFVIAMFLIQCLLTSTLTELPAELPPALLSSLSQPTSVHTNSTASRSFSASSPSWSMTDDERAQYDRYFEQLDVDQSGFVSGAQSRDFFVSSGLSSAVLATIWELADVSHDGRLTSGEFAVAMHLTLKQLQGVALPTTDRLPDALLAELQRSDRRASQRPLSGVNDSPLRVWTPVSSEHVQEDNSHSNNSNNNDALDRLQGELEIRRETLARTQQQRSLAVEERKRVRAAIEEVQQQLRQLESALQEQQDALQQEERQLEVLRVEKEALQTTLQQLQAELTQGAQVLQEVRRQRRDVQSDIQPLKEQQVGLTVDIQRQRDWIAAAESAATRHRSRERSDVEDKKEGTAEVGTFVNSVPVMTGGSVYAKGGASYFPVSVDTLRGEVSENVVAMPAMAKQRQRSFEAFMADLATLDISKKPAVKSAAPLPPPFVAANNKKPSAAVSGLATLDRGETADDLLLLDAPLSGEEVSSGGRSSVDGDSRRASREKKGHLLANLKRRLSRKDKKASQPVFPTAAAVEQQQQQPSWSSKRNGMTPNPAALAHLIKYFGFTEQEGTDALLRYDNDMDKATNYLLDKRSLSPSAAIKRSASGGSGGTFGGALFVEST